MAQPGNSRSAPERCPVAGLEGQTLASEQRIARSATVPARLSLKQLPWLAWYTSTTGWQWLGTDGLNRSSWYRRTANAQGPAQWTTPTGAINSWTWAPIRVSAGHGTHPIGAFEVIYWYARFMNYVWRFAPSQLNASTSGNYCSFP
jgi:hypothetical protein